MSIDPTKFTQEDTLQARKILAYGKVREKRPDDLERSPGCDNLVERIHGDHPDQDLQNLSEK